MCIAAIDIALEYWGLLLPFGLSGGALHYQPSSSNDIHSDDKYTRDVRYRNNHYQDNDVDMDEESDGEDEESEDGEGWGDQHTEWWLEYMREKGGKGVSKDTWQMVRFHCIHLFVYVDDLWTACRFRPGDRCKV